MTNRSTPRKSPSTWGRRTGISWSISMPPRICPRWRASGDLFNEQMKDRDAVRAALCMDRVSYLPDDLLTKVDRTSMLHALEVRSPYMDHELVQFAANLSTPQLLQGGGKRILREAFA